MTGRRLALGPAAALALALAAPAAAAPEGYDRLITGATANGSFELSAKHQRIGGARGVCLNLEETFADGSTPGAGGGCFAGSIHAGGDVAPVATSASSGGVPTSSLVGGIVTRRARRVVVRFADGKIAPHAAPAGDPGLAHRARRQGALLRRRRARDDGGQARVGEGLRQARAPDRQAEGGLMAKTWFITGTSRGFGREWAIAALERGDRVAATARDVASLDDLAAAHGDALLPLALDVTDRAAAFAAVARAHEHFGRLDVVVNNAGYGQFGMVEELSEEEARAQIETNVFGALWVTQAALPFLRAQGSGHILQVSSIGGISAFPGIGMYHASKWALEGLSQALAQEVAAFGVRVTLIEPGGYATDWGGSSARHTTEHPDYAEVRESVRAGRARRTATPGDPVATRAAVLELVDAEDPPLRVFFGTAPLGIATADYESRLAEWRAWEPLSIAAHGDGEARPEG